jgi:ElaA protein
MRVDWTIKHFNQLGTNELYDMIAIRLKVFVVEQNCPYQDLDGKDKTAHHLLGKIDGNRIIATARILPPGSSYEEISIGRVVLDESLRGMKIGNQLMIEAMQFIEREFGKKSIRISAQEYLEKFYQSLGFVSLDKRYLEDNIPHVEMIYYP